MCHTRGDSMLGNNISCLPLHSLFVVCQPPSSNTICAFNIKQSLRFQNQFYSETRTMCLTIMTTESQDLGLTSYPKDGAFSQYSVPVTILGHWDPHRSQGEPPCCLTNTSSSSNLVFSGGLPSRYWPAQPCLASVGNQFWAAGWYGCDIYVNQFIKLLWKFSHLLPKNVCGVQPFIPHM